MSERYFPGEKIRITIDAEVSDHSGDELEYTYPTALGTVEAVAVLDGSPVTIERVTPAEWPPRPGDLWRDQLGAVWFAADLVNDEGTPAIYMIAALGDHQVAPDYCNEKYGPLSFVHREDEQDGGTR